MTISRRDLMLGSGAAALAPQLAGIAAAQSAPPPQALGFDSRAMVAPELLPGLDLTVAQVTARMPTVESIRKSGRPVRIEEVFVPGPAGAPPVRVLLFTPTRFTGPRPGLLYIHGGGYRIGNPEMTIPDVVHFAQTCGGVVASTDYRLAPATRYPGSLEDNYAVLGWMHRNAAKLNVDTRRIAVGGFSAGGHSAALAIHARDRGEYPLMFQLLSCPMLDDRTASTVEPGRYVGQYIWTRPANRAGWQALLGVEPGGAHVPVGAVPARTPDLSGLPPAYLAVGQLDLFLDETLDYARRLTHAGVLTELRVFPGAYHGFDGFVPDAPLARDYRSAQAAALTAAFARTG